MKTLILILMCNTCFAQYSYIPRAPTPQVSRQDYYRNYRVSDFYPKYVPSRAFNEALNPYVNNFHYGVSNRGAYWYYQVK